ncbi:aldo/keto reductase family protein [Sphingopyxis panaciterrulae]|uniref:Aryl-alcohol dehydrogenase-like predicted oxidoreductase n=1 Tax=Sphingopyxis panaciterrulae TaxID=462372 RepID=A0A7W9B2C8_9SPHN|nr:aldo/keto reductase family protein [Sphingopyxis panaciterrulae]MBB5704949.1 aryl-alcohol dehydrogenase-like predicted oxidoreductase [Sphingopyxis panaciterrulae]
MQYRQLGDSGIEVSAICLGSWLTYGVGVDDSAGRACVDASLDAGINFIDTANIYGRGAAESFLGDALKGRPRDSYVLATKLFFPMTDTDKGLSAAQVAKQIDASLTRLRTDYVDLYQCHRYDPDTPLEETMEALSQVVRSGKARAIGFSEWAPEQIEAALALAPPNVKFVSSQPQYSLLYRRAEKKVIPISIANDIGQIVWSPLAQGVLSGKYLPGVALPEGSRATSDDAHFMQQFLTDPVLEAVQRLKPVADKAGCSLAQLAIAWVLAQPGITSAIVGASRPDQLRETARAADLAIDPASLAEAAAILEGVRIS